MKTSRLLIHSAAHAFISTQAAIVLGVITCGAGLLTYEWHHAHAASTAHHSSSSASHHHKKHEPKGSVTN